MIFAKTKVLVLLPDVSVQAPVPAPLEKRTPSLYIVLVFIVLLIVTV